MAKKENKEETKPIREEAIASTYGVRITPRKMRLVVDAIRGKELADAYAILENTNKRAVSVIYKTVKSAEANAVHNFHMDPSSLYIAVIHADDGPRLKNLSLVLKDRLLLLLRECHLSLSCLSRKEPSNYGPESQS